MATVEVKHIRITIGNQTLELSPEELKELRDVLDETFPTCHSITRPIVINTPPTAIPYPEPAYPPHWGQTWCDDNSTLSLMKAN